LPELDHNKERFFRIVYKNHTLIICRHSIDGRFEENEVKLSEDDSKKVMLLLSSMFPWHFAGFSEEIKNIWKLNLLNYSMQKKQD
jgi:hypothetical protein